MPHHRLSETECTSSARSMWAQRLGNCRAPSEPLLRGKSCPGLTEGEGSLGLADEHDEAWKMARLLGEARLEKEPLSSSILARTMGKVP